MATFRCLQSGNTVTFTLPYDIDSMRGHAGYVRVDVVDEKQEVPEIKPLPMIAPSKKRGRPRKFTI
jgi:hypothetical protein